jgi:hypothetical protein
MVDDEHPVAETREHALRLISLQPREPGSSDRRRHGVRGHEEGADEAEADHDHAPTDVVGRSRDLGLLAHRDQSRSPLSDGLGNRSVFEAVHPDVGCLPSRWERVDAPDTVLANEPIAE